ncbi:hypothetical protein H6F75_26985 [Nodosilinea sp. FACHB-131]|uniref:hypothetical protein n=1 Tax=Cyanophyceae TaxID=3028117 RepID=UPI0016893086|nr:hypothetical protein [Nodosilinea sp. FACHB-131]MBD1877132.1 hypothetical protein [Nodosilinea sp. FACHB-131]
MTNRYRLPEKTYISLRDIFEAKFYEDGNLQYKDKVESTWEEIPALLRQGFELPEKQNFKNFLSSKSLTFSKKTLEILCLLIMETSFDVWTTDLEEDEKPIPASATKQTNTPNTSSAGLIKVHNEPNPIELVKKILNSATNESWFFGTSLETSLKANPDLFISTLERGVTLRILFFNPSSKRRQTLAEELGINVRDVEQECESTLASIVKIMQEWKKIAKDDTQHSLIRVRLTDNFPRMRCYISDPKLDSALGFFIPSMNRLVTRHLPALECRKTSKGMLEKYFGGLHEEWKNSTTLKRFIKNDPTAEAHKADLKGYRYADADNAD